LGKKNFGTIHVLENIYFKALLLEKKFFFFFWEKHVSLFLLFRKDVNLSFHLGIVFFHGDDGVL
jgi:hypothetical protein